MLASQRRVLEKADLPIGLSEDTEVTVFIDRKLGVESLNQRPNIRCSSYRGGDIVGPIRESHADRLIYVEHIRIGIKAVRVQ